MRTVVLSWWVGTAIDLQLEPARASLTITLVGLRVGFLWGTALPDAFRACIWQRSALLPCAVLASSINSIALLVARMLAPDWDTGTTAKSQIASGQCGGYRFPQHRRQVNHGEKG